MTDLPLNKLVIWDGNVRKTGPSEALTYSWQQPHPTVSSCYLMILGIQIIGNG